MNRARFIGTGRDETRSKFQFKKGWMINHLWPMIFSREELSQVGFAAGRDNLLGRVCQRLEPTRVSGKETRARD